MKCLKTLCMIMTLSFMMSGNIVFAQVDYEPPVPIKGLDGYTICYLYAEDYYIADPDGKRVTPDYCYISDDASDGIIDAAKKPA